MKRSSYNSIISKILIILTISAVIAGLFILFKNSKKSPKGITQDTAGYNRVFPKILDATEDFWVNAGQKFKMDQLLCPELIIPDSKVDSRYLSCNPAFWECFWSKGVNSNPEIRVEYEGQVFHLKAVEIESGKFGKLVSKSVMETGGAPEWGYQVKLTSVEWPEFTIDLALLNSCQDFFLPKRVYAYGASQTARAQDVFLWDNFDREIYIDRYPVSNREINDWVNLHDHHHNLRVNEVKKWPYPATHLNLSQQQRYCADQGARLMETHLFDAASMLPSSDEKFPEVIAPSATPWERDRNRTFLSRDEKPNISECKKAAVKGCDIYSYNTNSATWAGMNYSLGFFPEAFRPTYDQFNMKFSSILLSPTSLWNRLGKRGIWSGEGNGPQDFGTGSLEENPFLGRASVPVSFRCYREFAL